MKELLTLGIIRKTGKGKIDFTDLGEELYEALSRKQ